MSSSPGHWPPLLAEALGEIESADSLVTWGLDAWGRRRIVGLRELRVAALLFASSQQQDESSASPDWAGLLDFVYEEQHGLSTFVRPASLLDLAVRFGHADVACCLHQRGQRQQRALGPYDFQRVPTESLATLPLRGKGVDRCFGEWRRNEENGAWEQEHWMLRGGRWQITQRLYKPLCPWGHWAQGDWVSDWNAATPCARMLVDAPATRAALALAAEGVPLDLEGGAAVRLLDAALLLGEPGAAAALADRCGSRRPVRLWPDVGDVTEAYPMHLDRLEAHLRAGHRELWALGCTSPAAAAAEAVEAGSRGLAQALSGLLGQDEPPAPLQVDGGALLRRDGAGTDVVDPAALDALEALGSPPPACSVHVHGMEVSLLLFSCVLGDERAARRLVRMGSTFTGLDTDDTRPAGLLSYPGSWLLVHSPDHSDLAPVPRRLEVAEGSLRQLFVAAARRSCCAIAATKTKGCNLLGRPELLEHVVGLAMSWSDAEEGVRQEVQRLIGHDPLGDLAIAPCAPWSRTAPSPAAVGTEMQAASLSSPGQLPSVQLSEAPGGSSADSSLDGAAVAAREPPASPRGAPSGEQQESSSAVPVQSVGEKDEAMENEELGQALQQSALEAVQAEQQDVQLALLLSKEEAFNDQVCVPLRLTKWSRDIVDTLLASQELLPCRQCVDAAGCELQPTWAGEALLLAPMTPELYAELGLKLTRHHVVIPVSHVGLLETALRALPCRRWPQVRWDHRADAYDPAADGGRHEQQDEEVEKEEEEEAEEQGSPHEQLGQEGSEQEHGEAGSEAGEVELAAFGIAEDARILREMYGILVECIFIPANNFDLSVASSRAVARSAPAEAGRERQDVQEQQQPTSGPGLHSCNPRRWRASQPPRAE